MNNTADPVMSTLGPCTAFKGHQRIASGPLPQVALAARRAQQEPTPDPVLIYSDATGRLVDVDLRGTDTDITARLSPPALETDESHTDPTLATAGVLARGRGRPKLGVVSREVTLLPRHWDWLSQQPGGASVTLRKMVDQARHADAGVTQQRQQQEAAYRFISSIAGDMPGFEEAARALFAQDQTQFVHHAAAWPQDVRDHAAQMAFGAQTA